MTKQPAATAQTKATLLEAFWSLYAEKPLHLITVKEITARAGYHRGTFYEYFRDVRACLDQIEELALPRLEDLPPMPGGPQTGPDPLAGFMALYRKKYRYYDLLLGERGDPAFHRKLVDSLKATIAGSGLVGADIPADELDYRLEYVLCGMIGILRHYFHGRPEQPPAEVAALVYRIMADSPLLAARPAAPHA